MKTLVEELCRHRQLELLSVIHLFCNCAAVYICFPADSPSLASLVAQQAALAPQPLQEAALAAIFHTVDYTPTRRVVPNTKMPTGVHQKRRPQRQARRRCACPPTTRRPPAARAPRAASPRPRACRCVPNTLAR